jgi:hypothetical protein
MNKEIEDILLQEIEGGYCSVPKMDKIKKAAAAIDRHLQLSSLTPDMTILEAFNRANILDYPDAFSLYRKGWEDAGAQPAKGLGWNDEALGLLKELVGELDRYDSRRLKFQQICRKSPLHPP